MSQSNPFTPTFGTAPPVLAGRADVIGRVSMAMDSGPRHPDYTLVVTGRRGTGKTVLLDVIARSAAEKGWLVLQVAGSDRPDLAANVMQRAHELVRPASWAAPALGFSPEATGSPDGLPDRPVPLPERGDLRSTLTALADQASANGVGVLLTVDELQASAANALRPLASILQHVTRREERPLMFVGCGLPDVARTLLSDPGMTFFHRCARAETSRLTDDEVRFALGEPFTAAGVPVVGAALDAGIAAAVGYPFMIQHIGYAAWERVDGLASTGVSAADMAAAIDVADLAMTQQLVEPVWVGLSAKDREFAIAIATLGGVAEVRELAVRLGWSANTVNAYRRRAIDAGIAVAAGRGRLRFAHQAFERHARSEHALADHDHDATSQSGA
ncbi:AAA family ATPase [Candidatus Poriferisodalis sp.]|uniref:ATP-binding protein n=1 Tax=Candidatus Poriferisodalis sp. TaxID=3101277 RepID=UPI003B015106